MELPELDGLIDRRILINYRVDPGVVMKLLPSHLDPLVINGYACGGICLLRLKDVGLKHSPAFLRMTSENAAHRFLVRVKESGGSLNGVYIPKRYTDSILNVVIAGKICSWPHDAASFNVDEGDGKYMIDMQSKDGRASLKIHACTDDYFPEHSMFGSIEDASCCFQSCALGVSPSARSAKFKAVHLKTKTWNLKPLRVDVLSSSYFENESLFPLGTIDFDNALLMEEIQHEWVFSETAARVGRLDKLLGDKNLML